MDKKTIDTIVWWISFRKTRDAVSKYLEFIYLNNENIIYKDTSGIIAPTA